MGLFSGSGLTPSLKGVVSNVYNLNAGQVQVISPAGWYAIVLSKYTSSSSMTRSRQRGVLSVTAATALPSSFSILMV